MKRVIIVVLIIANLGFLAGKKYADDAHTEEYPEISHWESDRMLDSLEIDLYSIFHQEFPAEKWGFELTAERWHFDKSHIFWNAVARAIADTGDTYAVVEYREEGDTAEEAMQLLMEDMRKGTDTLLIRHSMTESRR